MDWPIYFRCDSGGDCECLCDSIATFADNCAAFTTPSRWRGFGFCRKLFFIKLRIWERSGSVVECLT